MADCPNCGTLLTRHYCAECGQKDAALNPTVSDLLHDVVPELAGVDGKIFRSLRLLLTRPGFLTRELFVGRRVRYVAPLRLYLLCSVLFFGVSAVATPAVFAPDEEIEIGPIGRMLGLERMSPDEANAMMNRVMTQWVPRLMFVLVPVAALLVQLVTWRSGRNYPQHLYFALHVHAAGFAVLALSTAVDLLAIPWLSATAYALRTAFFIGYTLIAFHTAYGGSWPLATLRTLAVLFLYTNVITAALVAALAMSARL